MKTFNMKQYDKNIDYKFFEEMGVTVTKLLPWQFALSTPDLKGRFMWYPEGGSLIYELPEWGVHKVGEFTNSEDVYNEIKKKLVWQPSTP